MVRAIGSLSGVLLLPRLRSALLPAIVVAMIVASLLLGLDHYTSGQHTRAFPVAYGSTSGSVATAGVATSVNGQANLTG
jgi:hypothetical protein